MEKNGTTGGLAGSQELTSPKCFIVEQFFQDLSLYSGDAFEKIYNNKKGITISVIGDGGMEEGVVFETLNMASKMSLPILFICENNLYSTHTPLNERTLEKKPSNRVKSFNIDTDYFEGNDPDKLFNLMLKITKKIRKQKNHTLLK